MENERSRVIKVKVRAVGKPAAEEKPAEAPAEPIVQTEQTVETPIEQPAEPAVEDNTSDVAEAAETAEVEEAEEAAEPAEPIEEAAKEFEEEPANEPIEEPAEQIEAEKTEEEVEPVINAEPNAKPAMAEVGAAGIACPNCGKMCPEGDAFCIACGTRLNQPAPAVNVCPKCGTEVSPNSLFCINCGNRLK